MNYPRALAGLLAMSTAGCYTTKVYTGAPPYGPAYSERHWFTAGGLVSLSDPSGKQCQGGLSRAESTMAGMDILVAVGLGLAGGIAGAVACKDKSTSEQNSCASTGGSLAMFLIGSRTVDYTCAVPAGGGAPSPAANWPAQPYPAPYAPGAAPPPGAPGAPPVSPGGPPSPWTTPPPGGPAPAAPH